jgi:hypothetical protein
MVWYGVAAVRLVIGGLSVVCFLRLSVVAVVVHGQLYVEMDLTFRGITTMSDLFPSGEFGSLYVGHYGFIGLPL